jgi:hypothetical protein
MRNITPAQIRENNAEAARIVSGSIDHGATFPFTVQRQGDTRGVFNASTSEFTAADPNTTEAADQLAKALHAKHRNMQPGVSASYNPRG